MQRFSRLHLRRLILFVDFLSFCLQLAILILNKLINILNIFNRKEKNTLKIILYIIYIYKREEKYLSKEAG